MNNPAYTWIKSVNADSPINKEKSDKIRFFLFRRRKLVFGTPALNYRRLTPLAAVFVLSCLIYDARKKCPLVQRT
jgi:hypothetical protein